jgi:hypothetical protein
MKKSSRLKYATKRLKELKLKYKIFYGISGKNEREKKIIYSQYDREKVLSYLGREMGFNEIAGQWKIIKMFKYAIKKNIKILFFLTMIFIHLACLENGLIKKFILKEIKLFNFNVCQLDFCKKNT